MAFIDDHGVNTLVTQVKTWVTKKLNTKVAKEEGKGLSTNDFTDELRDTLTTVADGATKVSFTRIATGGTPIGSIVINDTETTLYASPVMQTPLYMSGERKQTPIYMNGNTIQNVGDPEQSGDAANKQYVDNTVTTGINKVTQVTEEALTKYLKKSGGTLSGSVDMDGNEIKNALSIDAEAVSADSVGALNVQTQLIETGEIYISADDGKMGAYIHPEANEDNKAVLNFMGTCGDEATILRHIAAPNNADDATNKEYVDEAIAKAMLEGTVDLSGYLKTSGGTMTDELKIGQGDGKGLQLGANGYVNATIGTNTKATVLAANSARTLVGSDSNKLQLRGNTARPNYITAGTTYELPRADEVLLINGEGKMTGDLDMGGKVIKELGTPTADTDAVNKNYVDSSFAGRKVEGIKYTLTDKSIVDALPGAEVFNDYANNKAIGLYSHAEGSNTTAYGNYSHVEGVHAAAMSDGSHAEGYYTTAYGYGAHVEGRSAGDPPSTVTSKSTADEIITAWTSANIKFSLAGATGFEPVPEVLDAPFLRF